MRRSCSFPHFLADFIFNSFFFVFFSFSSYHLEASIKFVLEKGGLLYVQP